MQEEAYRATLSHTYTTKVLVLPKLVKIKVYMTTTTTMTTWMWLYSKPAVGSLSIGSLCKL